MAEQVPLFSRFRCTLNCRKGQSVVEFTFAFIIFFAAFMAIVEFSHLLYTKVTLQHALGTAGRYMITGRTAKDADNQNIPRDQMIHSVFCANVIATGLGCPTLGGSDFTFQCSGEGVNVCLQPGGGPNQTVIVTVRMVKPAMMPFFSQFFPSGGVPFQLSTTWRNEPFA
jgi:Flp pilus assembly protein TadG